MDSQEAKDSCFHFNAINECRTKIARIKQEKVPIKKSIQTLEDDIDEIEKFTDKESQGICRMSATVHSNVFNNFIDLGFLGSSI